ncbi:MAG: carboxymuconolactone decarboxylase family protein [Candidatus Eremiobacteraeota bacterium]|nr:carboxymuconolactone decarboxylase family protein [Candidatus Eremiobacteraeota bacterium]
MRAAPSLFEALAARPRLARSLAAHVREVGEEGTVPQRTKELIALMVAWLNACDYCTCVHEDVAREIGVETATLAALGDFAHSAQFSDAERAALAAAVSLTREPRALPPALWEQLCAYYDEGSRIEVLAVIGLNNYVSRIANALPQ